MQPTHKGDGYEICELQDPKRVGIELCYPRIKDGRYTIVEVGLSDVRASDSILVLYDFERDGWVIKQASKFSWKEHEDCNSDWQEVAFVQAWGRELK